MSKLITIRKGDIPAMVSEPGRESFFAGIEELGGSVECVRRAGEHFAKIEDGDWKILKQRIPGEAQRWAQNARDVIKKGLHPAFALMAGTLGRKARKLPAREQARILREPLEVAILSDLGTIQDKVMKLASELTTGELDRVIADDSKKAWICEPKEQAARARAKLKRIEVKESASPQMEIRKPSYVVNNRGVTLKKKSLSFGQFQELAEDVAKIRKELSLGCSLSEL